MRCAKTFLSIVPNGMQVYLVPDLKAEIIKIIQTMKKAENMSDAAKQALNVPVVSKRFKIDGKSMTTGGIKTFFFYNEDEWNEFYKKKQYTHYPAWLFFYETISEW